MRSLQVRILPCQPFKACSEMTADSIRLRGRESCCSFQRRRVNAKVAYRKRLGFSQGLREISGPSEGRERSTKFGLRAIDVNAKAILLP